MKERSTLLAAMWAAEGDVEEILEQLETGQLQLTGNFKGEEAEISADARGES